MVNTPRKCATCPNVTTSVEGHHLAPLQYGGKKNGQLIDICGNCHTLVHRCIEDLRLVPPPALTRVVAVGRRAKELFDQGLLEARDRRPTLLIPMTPDDEKLLAIVRQRFNTKSRGQTMLAALRFAATYAGRVK